MNKDMFSKSYDAPQELFPEDVGVLTTHVTYPGELPKKIDLESGTKIKCPVCLSQTAVSYSEPRGPYVVGYHNNKFYLSRTQFVETECPLSGAEIKSEEETDHLGRPVTDCWNCGATDTAVGEECRNCRTKHPENRNIPQ